MQDRECTRYRVNANNAVDSIDPANTGHDTWCWIDTGHADSEYANASGLVNANAASVTHNAFNAKPTADSQTDSQTNANTAPHTGTVIGHTSQATNSATTFNNPADGQGSLLIHLSNGNFVACERPCTHVGVPINYDTGSQKLVCPAHGAIFDPLNGFSHVSGTGPSGLNPLPQVSIRVNADGTITTG